MKIKKLNVRFSSEAIKKIAVPHFEEVQINFWFPFYEILPSAFKIAFPHFEEVQKKPEGFF